MKTIYEELLVYSSKNFHFPLDIWQKNEIKEVQRLIVKKICILCLGLEHSPNLDRQFDAFKPVDK